MPAAAKPHSAWQRVITGIMGVPLAGIGLSLIALGAYQLAAECGDDGGFAAAAGALNARPAASDDVDWCSIIAIALIALGVGTVLVGVPFAIATIVPFGTFRRVMVGVGAAAFGGIVSAIILFLIGGGAAVLALPAAAGFFYLGYRIAR